MQKITFKLTRAGIIASLYIVLSLLTLPVSGGAIQFRVSEGLTLLPLLYGEAVVAIFIGCLLFNTLSGLVIYDIILGSLITLVSALLTYLTGRLIKNKIPSISIGGIFPILLNAFGLPLIWLYLCEGLAYTYWLQVLFLLISQSVSVYLFGSLFYLSLNRLKEKSIKYFM